MRILSIVITSCLMGCSATTDTNFLTELGRTLSESVDNVEDRINQTLYGEILN